MVEVETVLYQCGALSLVSLSRLGYSEKSLRRKVHEKKLCHPYNKRQDPEQLVFALRRDKRP